MQLYPCIMTSWSCKKLSWEMLMLTSLQISKYPCGEPNKWYRHLNTHVKMTDCIKTRGLATRGYLDIWYLAFSNVWKIASLCWMTFPIWDIAFKKTGWQVDSKICPYRGGTFILLLIHLRCWCLGNVFWAIKNAWTADSGVILGRQLPSDSTYQATSDYRLRSTVNHF